MFGSVDVMPTLLGLCGLGIPGGVQGHNLAGVVTGDGGEVGPDSVYLMNMGVGWPDREKWVGCWRGLRTQRWVYARWHNKDEHEIVLFDREDDPYEMKNLAGDPKFAKIEEEMEARLKKWMADTGDPFETGKRESKGMLEMGFMLQPRWRGDAGKKV
jgi:arylsulfatase A-like enzyme